MEILTAAFLLFGTFTILIIIINVFIIISDKIDKIKDERFKKQRNYQNLQEKVDNLTYCKECGVAINKRNSSSVVFFRMGCFEQEHFYCDKHKRPFNEITISSDGNIRYYKNQENNVEVNKKGKIIKK